MLQSSCRGVLSLKLVTMKRIYSSPCRFICIYSVSGSDATLKRSSVELIRAVLAYLSFYCGGYGSLPIGTHYFSHCKHLIFPWYHCWYSCYGSNSKLVVVIFLIACKHLVRHLAQWNAVREAKRTLKHISGATPFMAFLIQIFSASFWKKDSSLKLYSLWHHAEYSQCFYPFFLFFCLTLMPLVRGTAWELEHLGEARANNVRWLKLRRDARWNLCPSRCDTAALTTEPQWLSGIMSSQSSCTMPWRMGDSCTLSPSSEPSHLTHLLDLDNKVTVTLTVWM